MLATGDNEEPTAGYSGKQQCGRAIEAVPTPTVTDETAGTTTATN